MSKIIYCTHAKGGVGSSLLATNLAYSLAKRKQGKVLFIDANQLSDIASFFGVNPKKDIFNLKTFWQEYQTNTLGQKKLSQIFSEIVYQVNEMDVLLSPAKYHSLQTINQIYVQTINQAKKIYDYVIIETEKNNRSLFQKIKNQVDIILITTTVDNPAIIKTNSFLQSLSNHSHNDITETEFSNLNNLSEKIGIVCNQGNNFTLPELQKLFPHPILGSLPLESNAAWDNILLGIPIVENNKLAYSKEVEKIIDNILAKHNH